MKKVFFVLLFLLSTAAFAGPVVGPQVPTLTVGGRVFTDLKNLIILRCYGAGTTTVNCTPRKQGTSAGYTPSGTKSFRVDAFKIYVDGTSAGNGGFSLGYADNDVGVGTSTAFTNRVYVTGTAASSEYGSLSSLGSDVSMQGAIDFLVPNGKYIAITNNSGQGELIDIYGYEE